MFKLQKWINICDETAPRRMLTKILIDTGRNQQALIESTIAMESAHKVPIDYEIYIESLILNK